MADDVYMDDLLNQRAVYWAPLVVNDEGQKAFDDPIEVRCRWEDIVEEFITRGTGASQTSKSKVLVDQDLEELGVLWLPPNSTELDEGGAIAQLTSEDEPMANDDAFEIRRFDKIPNVDADEFVRIAYL
jgi:hypothetical protein